MEPEVPDGAGAAPLRLAGFRISLRGRAWSLAGVCVANSPLSSVSGGKLPYIMRPPVAAGDSHLSDSTTLTDESPRCDFCRSRKSAPGWSWGAFRTNLANCGSIVDVEGCTAFAWAPRLDEEGFGSCCGDEAASGPDTGCVFMCEAYTAPLLATICNPKLTPRRRINIHLVGGIARSSILLRSSWNIAVILRRFATSCVDGIVSVRGLSHVVIHKQRWFRGGEKARLLSMPI